MILDNPNHIQINGIVQLEPIDYVPLVIAHDGIKTVKRFLTFFSDAIRNRNTRAAYHRNACQFFRWCEQRGIDFDRVESFHISAYVEELLQHKSKSSVKQHLASLRMLFDWLVIGQVLEVNPAYAVRGPRLVVKKGKTPVLSEEQAKQLLAAIDTYHVVGCGTGR